MKHFIYTRTASRPRNGYRYFTIKVWRIERDRSVTYLGEGTDAFVTPNQQVMEFLNHHNHLPKKCKEKRENGCLKYGAHLLEKEKIARISLIEEFNK